MTIITHAARSVEAMITSLRGIQMKSWDEVAAKEGRIYCQSKNIWCAFVDMNNGYCLRPICVQDEREDKHAKGEQEILA